MQKKKKKKKKKFVKNIFLSQIIVSEVVPLSSLY